MKYHQTIKFAIMAMAALAFTAGSAFASIHIDGGNGTTGPHSENINTVDIENESEIEIDNKADADYDFELKVETGDNGFCENTEIDDIDTGDIEGEITIKNWLNSGDIDLDDAWDDWGLAMIDFSNNLTGPESVNNNLVNIEYERDLEIENHADIDNDFEVKASTGDNRVSHNTVVGDFSTGSIEIEGYVENKANAGMADIDLGSSGISNVNADFSNHITGPNSENVNELKIESEMDLEIENRADIDNDLEICANTGDNYIGHNTVVGDVSTGDVEIDFSVLNVAN